MVGRAESMGCAQVTISVASRAIEVESLAFISVASVQ